MLIGSLSGLTPVFARRLGSSLIRGWPRCHDPRYASCARPPHAAGCHIISGYSALADMDHGGADDIGFANSGAEAAAVCMADSNCKGFNSAGFLKSSVTPTTPTAGMCLYTRLSSTGECHQPPAHAPP